MKDENVENTAQADELKDAIMSIVQEESIAD